MFAWIDIIKVYILFNDPWPFADKSIFMSISIDLDIEWDQVPYCEPQAF